MSQDYERFFITQEQASANDAQCNHAFAKFEIAQKRTYGPDVHYADCPDCSHRVYRAAHKGHGYEARYDNYRTSQTQYKRSERIAAERAKQGNASA